MAMDPAAIVCDMPSSPEKAAPVVVSDTERITSALNALIQMQTEQAENKTAFWDSYMKLADEHDKEFQKKYSNDLDTALIFAGLFSAVGSAFIIQIQPELANHRPIIIVAQTLLYISLFTALLAALLAVLGKQWVMYYEAAGSRGTLEQRGLERQRKFDGLRRWKFDAVLQSFPLLLQLALFLFSTGLSIYLWTVDRTIAIVVMALTCSGFTAYILLLASTIVYPDSPFENPLAPFLVRSIQMVGSTLDSGIFHIFRQLFKSVRVWLKATPIFKPGKHILPYFATNVSTPSLEKPLSELGDLFSEEDFSPPSSEIPAVLWVLETSTDPKMIESAAEMAAGLQWPLGLGLSQPMARLAETFNSCFETSRSHREERNVRPGAIRRALNCGRGYGALNVVAQLSRISGTDPEQRTPDAIPAYRPSYGYTPDGHDTADCIQLRHVSNILTGTLSNYEIEHLWSDPVAIQWALHVFRCSLAWGSINTASRSRFQIEDWIRYFFEYFPPPQFLYNLDHATFANYLCSLNSVFGPIDSRLMAQLDKSSFRESLLTHFFNMLRTKPIDGHLVARLLSTTARLADKSDKAYSMAYGKRWLRLLTATNEFCASFPQVKEWLSVVVSAATLARVEDRYVLQDLHAFHPLHVRKADPRDVEWIYMALDHIQLPEAIQNDAGSWDGDEYIPNRWDYETTRAVDGLLQLLAWCGALPAKPPLKVVQVLLQALSQPSTRSPAFVVLHQSRNWFLDPGLQQLIHESCVWPRVARLTDRSYNPSFFSWRYIDMVSKVSHVSAWQPFLYKEPNACFSALLDAPEPIPIETATSIIRNIWAPEFDENQHTFGNDAEHISTLIVVALSNMWSNVILEGSFPFRETLDLARCTIHTVLEGDQTLRIEPYDPSSLTVVISNVKTIFCTRLEESLRGAAANVREALAKPHGLDPYSDECDLQQFPQLLEVIGQKIGTFEPSGDVQLGGSVKAYNTPFDLRKLLGDALLNISNSLRRPGPLSNGAAS
ncbi:hypothetical protein MVEN_00797000 [Mycena venus]|uniref:DUF6535 domain-containing protein n=1 Tax=Mycena venus TaxID=2733690 RepID=A0A8H6YIY1_9AGAR|nr:hypothetical protein MVEN_00797000 [Mycena venus]